MLFSEANDFLYSFLNYEVNPAKSYEPGVFGLGRIRQLLDGISRPHEHYPCIHIAGTKGKGSVAAMVASVLNLAGHRVGLYTSPHLVDIKERFRVGRNLISREDFASVMAMLRPRVEEINGITFFEIITALAFEWFARQHVDVAVLEVGLGGRLDATNVVTPVVSAVTPISFDHVTLLGDTLTKIAIEKAGIIKQGVPVVCAPQEPDALAQIEDAAKKHQSAFSLVGRDWVVERGSPNEDGEIFLVHPASMPSSKKEYSVPLFGAHQVENACVTIALLEELRKQGWRIGEDAVSRGLKQVDWPARCQIVPGNPPIVIDCAHNTASIAVVVAMLRERFPKRQPVLVFGSMRDKDNSGMLATLLPVVSIAIFTRAEHPRASEPEDLAALGGDLGVEVSVAANIADAIEQARILAGGHGLVLVTGSVAFAGEAYIALCTSPANAAGPQQP